MSAAATSKEITNEAAVPTIPMSAAWERLRFIDSEIHMMLNLLTAGDTLRPGVASPELITVLLNYLEEVDTLRQSGQLDESSPRADAVWRAYRATLERMNHVVPKMEQQLMNDRTRLAQEQSQLVRASAWNYTRKLTR